MTTPHTLIDQRVGWARWGRENSLRTAVHPSDHLELGLLFVPIVAHYSLLYLKDVLSIWTQFDSGI